MDVTSRIRIKHSCEYSSHLVPVLTLFVVFFWFVFCFVFVLFCFLFCYVFGLNTIPEKVC